MTNFSEHPLCDASKPLQERLELMYRLKSVRTRDTLQVMLAAIDTTTSVLFQHELLYTIGQLGFEEAMTRLEQVASDATTYDVVSRHEAIEAMGAICIQLDDTNRIEKARGMLAKLANVSGLESEQPVIESAQLAYELVTYRLTRNLSEYQQLCNVQNGYKFGSFDPAPPWNEPFSLEEMTRMFENSEASLFQRYRAMFTLRNIGSSKAIDSLCNVLATDRSSALLRHEIAFVLGQLMHRDSLEGLSSALRNQREHPMVRHEAAEALGGVLGDILSIQQTQTMEMKNALLLLKQLSESDEPAIISDSCIAALQALDYWTTWSSA